MQILVDNQSVLEVLRYTESLVEDSHFVFKNGGHSRSYVNKAALTTDTRLTNLAAAHMAHPFVYDKIDTVVGAAEGGISLAMAVAGYLNLHQFPNQGKFGRVMWVYSAKNRDPQTKKLVFERGFTELIDGARVLLVDDIATTGSTLEELLTAVEEAGAGSIAGVTLVCDRGNVTAQFATRVEKFYPISQLDPSVFRVYSEEECRTLGPCAEGKLINLSLGHGREWIDEKCADKEFAASLDPRQRRQPDPLRR